MYSYPMTVFRFKGPCSQRDYWELRVVIQSHGTHCGIFYSNKIIVSDNSSEHGDHSDRAGGIPFPRVRGEEQFAGHLHTDTALWVRDSR